jgi:hypothetical protein
MALSHRLGLVAPLAVQAKGMKRISYSGYRFPPEIVHQAIWLYLRFTLSFRDVEHLLPPAGGLRSLLCPTHLQSSCSSPAAGQHRHRSNHLRRQPPAAAVLSASASIVFAARLAVVVVSLSNVVPGALYTCGQRSISRAKLRRHFWPC